MHIIPIRRPCTFSSASPAADVSGTALAGTVVVEFAVGVAGGTESCELALPAAVVPTQQCFRWICGRNCISWDRCKT
jgi:hypothetical protein